MYRCILHYVFDLAVILRTIRNFKGWPQFLFGGQSFVVALLLFWISVASLATASPPQDVPKPPTIIARPQLAWARFQRNTFWGDFCADRLSWGITSPSSSFWRRNLCSNILMVSPQRFHLIPVELILILKCGHRLHFMDPPILPNSFSRHMWWAGTEKEK